MNTRNNTNDNNNWYPDLHDVITNNLFEKPILKREITDDGDTETTRMHVKLYQKDHHIPKNWTLDGFDCTMIKNLLRVVYKVRMTVG